MTTMNLIYKKFLIGGGVAVLAIALFSVLPTGIAHAGVNSTYTCAVSTSTIPGGTYYSMQSSLACSWNAFDGSCSADCTSPAPVVPSGYSVLISQLQGSSGYGGYCNGYATQPYPMSGNIFGVSYSNQPNFTGSAANLSSQLTVTNNVSCQGGGGGAGGTYTITACQPGYAPIANGVCAPQTGTIVVQSVDTSGNPVNVPSSGWTITGPATLTGSGSGQNYLNEPAGSGDIYTIAVPSGATPSGYQYPPTYENGSGSTLNPPSQTLASNGATITFKIVWKKVNIALSCSVSSQNANTGQSVTFTGGGGNGTFMWSFSPPPGLGGTLPGGTATSQFSTSFTASGTVNVALNDGSDPQVSCPPVTITAPGGSGGSGGNPPPPPPTGTITASPNPCTVVSGQTTCTSNITPTWSNAKNVQVWVTTSASGNKSEFSSSPTSGGAAAYTTVTPGTIYTFTLMDMDPSTCAGSGCLSVAGQALASVSVTGQYAATCGGATPCGTYPNCTAKNNCNACGGTCVSEWTCSNGCASAQWISGGAGYYTSQSNCTSACSLPTPPQCGTDNGLYFSYSLPQTGNDLCNAGTDTGVGPPSPWLWSCRINGSPQANCSATELQCTTPTYKASTSGFSTSTVGGVKPTITVAAGQIFYAYVDYGKAGATFISAPYAAGSGNCVATTAWLGTAQVFQCVAGATGSYTYKTGTNSNLPNSGTGYTYSNLPPPGTPNGYTCGSTQTLGTVTVTPAPPQVGTLNVQTNIGGMSAAFTVKGTDGTLKSGIANASFASVPAQKYTETFASSTVAYGGNTYNFDSASTLPATVPNGGSATLTLNYDLVPLTPVNGACGSAATDYAYNASAYSGAFCSSGTPSPSSPGFPTQGGSSSWTCDGANGGSNSPACVATRDSAPCTVTGVSATCSPSIVAQGGVSQCTAVVNAGSGSCNTDVTWTMVSGGGSINSSGAYTAPNSQTTAVVQATSKQDPSKFGTATISVWPSVSCSFSASPTRVVIPETSTLSWVCSGVTSCTVSGPTSNGSLPQTFNYGGTANQSIDVAPDDTYSTYELTCYGAGGGTNPPGIYQTTVSVSGPGVIETPPPSPAGTNP